MQTILTPLQKSILIDLKLYKAMVPYLLEFGLDLSPQQLYDELYGNPGYCNGKFISFSVGYRACKKSCKCYIENLSNKMRKIKSSVDASTKSKINSKKQTTVLQRYGVQNVAQLNENKEKSKQTKFERYNDENFNNRPAAIQSNLDKYGVENPMQSFEIKKSIDLSLRNYEEIAKIAKQTKLNKYGSENFNNREKSAATSLTKYGKTNPAQSEVVKSKIQFNLRDTLYDRMAETYKDKVIPLFSKEQYQLGIDNKWQCVACGNVIEKSIVNGQIPRCTVCHPYSTSNFEVEVREYIQSLTSSEILFNDRTLIAPKELDIVLPDYQLAIECNGLYRHTEHSGNKNRNYHLHKSQAAENAGFSLFHIMDLDWYEKQDIVKSMLAYKLHKSSTLYARKGSVIKLEKTIADRFFKQNHLQGSATASIAYGLYIHGQLVSAMTFSKSRYDKNADWEIVRFCSVINHNVSGAAAKLLAHFRKQHSGSIVTYADKSYGRNSFYEQLGFTHMHDSTPGYRYTKNGELFSRLLFQKHKLKSQLTVYDDTKTEWENMLANGYDRIWDCGHRLYFLN